LLRTSCIDKLLLQGLQDCASQSKQHNSREREHKVDWHWWWIPHWRTSFREAVIIDKQSYLWSRL